MWVWVVVFVGLCGCVCVLFCVGLCVIVCGGVCAGHVIIPALGEVPRGQCLSLFFPELSDLGTVAVSRCP